MPFMTIGEPRSQPPKLTGPVKTRAEARKVYAQIISELTACEDEDTLNAYLMTIGEELIQFENELDYLWSGDGADFLGLSEEIRLASLRCAVFW